MEPLARIHVNQTGKGPVVVVHVRGADPQPLPTKLKDLRGGRRQVESILREFKEKVGGETSPTPARLTEAVRHLYMRTQALGLQLVQQQGDYLRRIGESLRPAWQHWDDPGSDVPVIEVVGHDFGFPFEMLPLFDVESDPPIIERPDQLASAMRRFVGYSALVRRETSAPHYPDIIGAAPLRVRFLRYAMTGADSEYAFLSTRKDMDVEGPWPPESVEQADVAQKLVGALINPRLVLKENADPPERDPPVHIVHFACHCYTDKPSDAEWEIELGRPVKPLKVLLYDLRQGFLAKATSTDVRPLVFMNACGTSVINATTSASFQEWFLANGHRGFIGTETAVPDRVAAVFAQGLYEALLDGQPLGQAMVLARRRLIKDCSNPLGILWVIHADPRLQLLPAPGSTSPAP